LVFGVTADEAARLDDFLLDTGHGPRKIQTVKSQRDEFTPPK
jgi:hypothetical protein